MTNEDLICFSRKYSLDRFFKVDNEKEPNVNKDDLNQSISALQPCRVCVYDGQHHWISMQFGLIHYFSPGKRVVFDEYLWKMPLKRAMIKYGIDDIEKLGEKQFQCHRLLSIKIGNVISECPFS